MAEYIPSLKREVKKSIWDGYTSPLPDYLVEHMHTTLPPGKADDIIRLARIGIQRSQIARDTNTHKLIVNRVLDDYRASGGVIITAQVEKVDEKPKPIIKKAKPKTKRKRKNGKNVKPRFGTKAKKGKPA